MENYIKVETCIDSKNTRLTIDNGTNFKELSLTNGDKTKEVNIQMDLEEGTMEVNGIPISPTVKDLIIKFLTQSKTV